MRKSSNNSKEAVVAGNRIIIRLPRRRQMVTRPRNHCRREEALEG